MAVLETRALTDHYDSRRARLRADALKKDRATFDDRDNFRTRGELYQIAVGAGIPVSPDMTREQIVLAMDRSGILY